MLKITVFSVGLIPHTQDETNLANLQINDEVNLETDIIGKYVAKKFRKEKLKWMLEKFKMQFNGMKKWWFSDCC